MTSTASRSPASSDVHASRRRHPPLYFTLIHDTTAAPADLILDEAELATQSTRMRTATRMHHPRLHYLFSDDPDDPEYPSPLASATQHQQQQQKQQRVLIVDFADDAQSILRTTSLSPEWQVTNTSTSALAMRSSSSTAPYRSSTPTTAAAAAAAADIGKMLTIEGVGASAENFEVLSNVVKKKKMQASTAVPAETDLGNAFMYADLFNQTNQRLESLIQQSPPSLYTDTLARLKTELNHLSDVTHPTDNSANSLHENLANTARMRESLAALRKHSQSQSASSSLQGGAYREAAEEESEQSEQSEESESEESEEEQSEHSEEEDDDQPMFATEIPPTSIHPSPSPSASPANDNTHDIQKDTLAASVADLNLTPDDAQPHPTTSTAHEDDVHSSQSSHEDLVPRS
ncbi:hypothetical protein BZA70DRAFT_283915 [Myxozyma melibiosi]|uniref:Transcription elongation factor Eaf N-terminal domain-containing protein n=1 Tax=Myxozyma melibiosi TaxID=54550 RepID=A0ABR1EZU9_9ASCO